MHKVLPWLFLLITACQQQTESTAEPTAQDVVIDENTATIDPQRFELTPVEGTDLQTAVRRNPEGKVMEMGHVDAAMRKQGDWTVYHSNNRLPASFATFVDGKYHGGLINIDIYGKVDEMMHYNMGELDGPYVKFRIAYTEIEANYKAGKLDGLYKEYDFRNGNLKREIEFTDGQKDGFDRQYNDDGSLLIEYTYENGELLE
ncbi:MAG: hypothetical protein AAGF87_14860 [Bacteroidota bacterium]